ncbi:MAG: hypothetical protein NUW06_00950 [Candidatus Acetothermia bacterium]|nr:hypothetical protein [Candidatus Acetothermia bacterium]MDH7505672.1 hypothetical protein [Candidatus Acetothermia bacterium]
MDRRSAGVESLIDFGAQKEVNMTISRKVISYSVLALWLAVSLVFGQCRAELPSWDIGLYWQYSYGPPEVPTTPYDTITSSIEYWVLARVPEGIYVLFSIYKTAHGPIPFLAYADMQSPYPTVASRFEGPVVFQAYAFPLEVGKQWVARPGHDAEPVVAEVQGIEMIQTGFGTFDTFHVRYQQGATVISDLYYAPGVKTFVKQAGERGILALEESWQFTPEATLATVFAVLEEVSSSRPDLTLEILQRLIELGIGQQQALSMMDELLTPDE